jgi:hypothetical protein
VTWVANEQQHTFGSGRTFTVRRGLSMSWLMSQAIARGDDEVAGILGLLIESGGKIDDGAVDLTDPMAARAVLLLQRDIVEAMFLKPRVVYDPDQVPEGMEPDPDTGVPPVVCASDLHDSELTEALTMAFEGVADATRFPGLSPGGTGGTGGEGVGVKPKRNSRASGGKR